MLRKLKSLQLGMMLAAAAALSSSSTVSAQPFLVSGYGDTIYGSFLNKNGTLDAPVKLADQAKPSFFTQHPTLPIVYVVSETMRNDEKNPAKLVAYRVEFGNGGRVSRLVEINSQPVNGDIGCHVTVDSQGRFVFVSNYINGSVVGFRIEQEGKLGAQTCNVVHAIPEGKTRSNGHCSVLTPDEKHLLVCDLGLDRVFNYTVDYSTGQLQPASQPFVALPNGAGPRHLTFHPNGKHLFIINELNMTMTSAQWDATTGQIRLIHTEDTVPQVPSREGFSTAEVLVHPNGKFVYGSNRGHDSIVLMSFDEPSGVIKRIDTFSTEGKTPRNFRIDPTGQYLLAENQNSNSVVVFKIDSNTGRLTKTGNAIEVNGPTCLRFIRN